VPEKRRERYHEKNANRHQPTEFQTVWGQRQQIILVTLHSLMQPVRRGRQLIDDLLMIDGHESGNNETNAESNIKP
jgi:hypothetical protein